MSAMPETEKGLHDYGEKGMAHEVEEGKRSPGHSGSGDEVHEGGVNPLTRALHGRHMQVCDRSLL